MSCPKCGTNVPDTAWSCPYCGARSSRQLFPRFSRDLLIRLALAIVIPLLVYAVMTSLID